MILVSEYRMVKKMNTGKIVAGIMLLVIAMWVFMTISDAAAKYIGGAILGIIGLATLARGIKR